MATMYDQFAPPTDTIASSSRWRDWLQSAMQGGDGGNTFNWQMQADQPTDATNWAGIQGALGTVGNAFNTASQQASSQQAASNAGAGAGAAAAAAVGTAGSDGAKTGTAGRTGATYAKFLAANPQFDPWTNLDAYAGDGAGNDPIIAQAFGWTNQWARANGYGDGSQIPLAERQKVFLSNLERARQQWADNAANATARQGVTWETSAASRIPNEGWAYTPGWGLTHPGQSYEPTQAAAAAGAPPPTSGTPPAPNAPGAPPAPPAPTAPPASTGGGVGSGTGTGSVGYNTQMATDKAFRMAQLLDTMGLGDPNRQHSYVGNSLANTYTQLFDPWTKTQGLGGENTMDNWQGMMADFARKVQSPGGFGALSGDATSALQRLPGLAANLDDSELMGLTSNFNQLRNMPMNPVMQRYYNNVQDDSFGQFLSQLGQIQRGQGDAAAASFRYLPFIQGDPRYRGLMG